MKKNELTVLENELVPVYVTSSGEKVVYGSELHRTLEVKSNYRDWIRNRISDIEAVEGADFQAAKFLSPSGQTKHDYIIKLDTAKEMAMLERNDKGKQVRRYFIQVEKRYKAPAGSQHRIAFKEQIEAVGVVADLLKVNDASKVLMIESHFRSYNLPTDFLPAYVSNGNREYKSATELLKEYGIGMSAVKLNQRLQARGYLEEKERKSSNGNRKKFKALTDKGLKYGENLINPKNQKEVQPCYYTDTFMELVESVIE